MTAYRIVHPFTTLSGRRYRRMDYYEPRNATERDELARAQFAHALEEGATPPPARPKLAPQPAPTPEVEDGLKEDEPDWSFQTIKAMRSWLDSSGVALPKNSRSRAPHEDLCRDAWLTGARPHPLYGLPGGPDVAAGLPGPNAADASAFAEALNAARQADVEIPAETIAAYEALTKTQDAQERASEDAGEPISEDVTGTPDSPNEDAEDAPEAEEDLHEMVQADEGKEG